MQVSVACWRRRSIFSITDQGDPIMKKKASVSKETFDEFLAEQGVLGACEERAIKEIIAEQLEDGGAELNRLPSS
jgi:hypothetical protein